MMKLTEMLKLWLSATTLSPLTPSTNSLQGCGQDMTPRKNTPTLTLSDAHAVADRLSTTAQSQINNQVPAAVWQTNQPAIAENSAHVCHPQRQLVNCTSDDDMNVTHCSYTCLDTHVEHQASRYRLSRQGTLLWIQAKTHRSSTYTLGISLRTCARACRAVPSAGARSCTCRACSG